MKKLLLTLMACVPAGLLMAQVNITTAGVAVTENFDGLAGTGTSGTTPAGWQFTELGANGNATYAADNGAANAGNTYSYGAATTTDRAFGALASGNLQSVLGASYTNQTGSAVTSITITYTMEQWRRGGSRTTNDTMQFSYGIGNSSLTAGTWTRFDALDAASKVLGGAAGALDGNLPANQNTYTETINVTLQNNETLVIRWTDINVGGADDGLAVDDFSITFNGGTPPPSVTPVSNVTFSDVQTTSAKLSFTHSNYDALTHTTLVFLKQDAAVVQGTPGANAEAYVADADFALSPTAYEHDAAAKCVLNGDEDSVIITNLVPGKTYHALVYVLQTTDTTYSPAATQFTTTIDTAQPPPAPEYPLYNIGQINSVNGLTGAPDSLGVKVTVRGIAIGFNQRTSASGIQLSIVDATGATTLFNASNNFGYTVTEGDSIYARGAVATFRGLHEINIDSLWLGSAPAAVPSPLVVTVLNEASESRLVRLNNVRFATAPSGSTWATASTNYPIVTQAGDTFTLRLLSTSALAGQPLPATALFNVAGIGTQFSTSSTSPFPFNGYQIYPRTAADITAVVEARPVPIGSINSVSPITGVPDSLGSSVFVRGVVIGFNQRTSPTGIQFTIMDGTGGTTLFSASKNFGYTVTEGDSIYAKGSVATFRGLHEINLDTIWKGGTAPFAITPRTVTALNESTENDLVKIEGVRFANAPAGANWATASTNYPLVTPAGDTITLRLLSTSALAGEPLPENPTFDVTGIGTQFSTTSTAPFAFNGYQVYPRSASDIGDGPIGPEDSIGTFSLVSPANNMVITIDSPYTNTTAATFRWTKPAVTSLVQEVYYFVEFDTITGNFDSIYFDATTDGDLNDTFFVFTESLLQERLDEAGFVPGQTIYCKWRVFAASDNAFSISNQTLNITFEYVNSPGTGLKNSAFDASLRLYPNPAAGFLHVKHSSSLERTEILDQAGRNMLTTELKGLSSSRIDISTLPAGLYFMTIYGADGSTATRKLVIN